jgi:hypothetical protein
MALVPCALATPATNNTQLSAPAIQLATCCQRSEEFHAFMMTSLRLTGRFLPPQYPAALSTEKDLRRAEP